MRIVSFIAILREEIWTGSSAIAVQISDIRCFVDKIGISWKKNTKKQTTKQTNKKKKTNKKKQKKLFINNKTKKKLLT